MIQARRRPISLSETPCYHCIDRGVRRTFPWAEGRHCDHSIEHRWQWIVDKI